jgi:hypothetical protein
VVAFSAYRFWFGRHNGVEANYAWTNNTEKYNKFGVDNNSHEVSAAYVFRMPWNGGRRSFSGAPVLCSSIEELRSSEHPDARRIRLRWRSGHQPDRPLLRTRRISRVCIQLADLRPCQFEGTRSRDASRGAHDRIRLEVLTRAATIEHCDRERVQRGNPVLSRGCHQA